MSGSLGGGAVRFSTPQQPPRLQAEHLLRAGVGMAAAPLSTGANVVPAAGLYRERGALKSLKPIRLDFSHMGTNSRPPVRPAAISLAQPPLIAQRPSQPFFLQHPPGGPMRSLTARDVSIQILQPPRSETPPPPPPPEEDEDQQLMQQQQPQQPAVFTRPDPSARMHEHVQPVSSTPRAQTVQSQRNLVSLAAAAAAQAQAALAGGGGAYESEFAYYDSDDGEQHDDEDAIATAASEPEDFHMAERSATPPSDEEGDWHAGDA